jgi:ATP-dependent RNA helicase RhlE
MRAKNAVTVNLERKAAPAVGITQAAYPVAQELKSSLLVTLLTRGDVKSVLVFTRTKHRANRLAAFLARERVACERIHGNRTQSQRTAALAGFKAGRFRVLVATDIAARGSTSALSHVVNFDVPGSPDDHIHRVGRTARAEATGDAFTFVAPDEENDLRAIERDRRAAAGHGAGFRSRERTAERLPGPTQHRLAAMRSTRPTTAHGRARGPRHVQKAPVA